MAQMKVFVSHSHEDDTFCRALVDGLRHAGADVWYDEHNLGSGQLLDTIETELRERPVFVVVLSPAALNSQWVRSETKWAFQQMHREPSRILLPVLTGTVNEADIWLFLQDFKRIEAPGVKPFPQSEAISHTLHALQLTLPGETPLSAAQQPAAGIEDLIEKGKGLLAQKRYGEARAALEQALAFEPNSALAWYYMSNVLDMSGRRNEAQSANDKALALDPKLGLAWNKKGVALSGQGRYSEALAAYERATELDPNNASAWYNKGDALAALRRFADAAQVRSHARSVDPWAWRKQAISLRQQGRTVEADEAERRAEALGG